MKRRDFFNKSAIVAGGIAAGGSVNAMGTTAPPMMAKTKQRLSVKRLKEWQDLRYGMFIHYGMSTFLGQELPDGKAPLDAYAPTALDVSQWISVAKAAGMKYAVLTAKHVAGHCLWPTAFSDYSVANNADDTNVVGVFVEECRKQGIEPGIYYCAWDNHHLFNSRTPSMCGGYGDAMKIPTEKEPYADAPYTTHLYQSFMTAQIDELLEAYSPLVQFWIDIPIVLGNGYRQFIYEHIAAQYPEMLVIMNHGQKKEGDKLVFMPDKAWPTDALTLERYTANEPYDPVWNIHGQDVYMPGESNMPVGKEWFFEDDDMPKPMDELEQKFRASWDNNINFLLNVPPDRTGNIPERWIKPMMELKKRCL